MPARDIRRQLADTQPNNYIAPGVADTSLASLIQGGGETALQLDKALAKERFGDALETLRSEYMVSNPVSANMQDAAGNDPAADTGSALTGDDKRQLRDFEDTLRTNDAAVAQGRMTYDAFRLRAERLYRTAISKRPGLAQDFREVASNLLGRDVVGASLDILQETEAEIMRANAAKAKSVADLKLDEEKARRKLLEDNQILTPPDIHLGDARFDEYFASVFPLLSQRVQAKAAVTLAETQTKLTDAGNKANLPAATTEWVARAGLLRSDVATFGTHMRQQILALGPNPDPGTVRQILAEGSARLDNGIAQLEAAAAGGAVESSVVAREMARIEDTRKRLADVLSGTDDRAITENGVKFIEQETLLTMLNDEEYRTTSVLLKDLPASIAPILMNKMDKSMTLLSARMLQETASPELVAQRAEGIAGAVIASVLTKNLGGTAAPDPKAVEVMSKLLVSGAQSFYMVNDGAFRLEHFTGSMAKPGFIQVIQRHLPALQQHMTKEQQLELGQAIAAGTANAVRVAGAAMFQEAPGLKGMVKFDFSPDKGAVFVQKSGTVLQARDQQILAKYNRAFNAPMIGKVLGALVGADPTAAWGLVQDSYQPVTEARQKLRKAGAGTTPAGGGSTGSEGHTGPVTKWWE